MPPAVQGARIGDRYRLEAELGRGNASVVWRATDERLERQVSLRIFDGGVAVERLQEQAALAASLTHPRVVRLFDTGFEGERFYTVSELLPGSLGWARLPLGPQEAVDIGVHVCEALSYAHDRGVVHGNLHRGNVLLSEQGAKVGDFAIADASDGGSPKEDLVALGQLLYEVRTGEATARRPMTDEPAGMAEVIRRLRNGQYDNASDALNDLKRLRGPTESQTRRAPSLRAIAAAVVLLAVGAFALTRLGDREPGAPRSTEPPRITGTPYDIATVQDFDPLGDNREGRRTVENVYDRDPNTFWSTERYSGGPDFSGLKEGVGVILDLGSSRTVGKAQVLFVTEGCSFEIRHSQSRARRVEDWTTAGGVRHAGRTGALEFSPATSRWWLVWITELARGVPGARGGYACAISEADVYSP